LAQISWGQSVSVHLSPVIYLGTCFSDNQITNNMLIAFLKIII
jgi:hypothetical protein